MNKGLTLLLLLSFLSTTAIAQSPIGMWANIDDEDGQVKSHLEIYEKEGKVYAKVVELMENATIRTCDKCPGDLKGKDLIGLDIMWDLEFDKKNKWKGGQIMDPKNGKIYKCKIELKDDDTLKVRGYIGISAFGRTQEWYRVKEG